MKNQSWILSLPSFRKAFCDNIAVTELQELIQNNRDGAFEAKNFAIKNFKKMRRRMRSWTQKITVFSLAAIYFSSGFAIQWGQPFSTSVAANQTNNRTGFGQNRKQVTLIKVHLSDQELTSLKNSIHVSGTIRTQKDGQIPSYLPSKIDLGMNQVPVLNQGAHGTCVTFAMTAALDALLGKGDYISQLCSLELGKFLETKSDMPSGWDGSFGPWISNQLLRFGVISKQQQLTQSCAGVTEYPVDNPNNEGRIMSLDQFQKMSQAILHYVYFNHLLNAFERAKHLADVEQGAEVLAEVKRQLAQRNRIPFGTLLVETPYCDAGACARYHAKDDTWAITQDIENPAENDIAGHEMLIIGYDDKAVAIDHQGKKHQGLLILRNSWGDDVGDQGNYYMTYDYFKVFVNEASALATMDQLKLVNFH